VRPGAWPGSAEALAREQERLAAAAPEPWRPPEPGPLVAACFVCFPRGLAGEGAAGDRAWAAAAAARGRRVVAVAAVTGAAGAPYAAGLLALREGPLLERAVRALRHRPDLLMVNATGRDHPRRAGLALHLGAVLDLPSVGITHRPLLAQGAPPADEPGATSALMLDGDAVALWVRVRPGARPLVAHAGWRTDPQDAAAVLLAASAGSRAPEPLRQARRAARLARARAG
jgi:deoxyribonuclease V